MRGRTAQLLEEAGARLPGFSRPMFFALLCTSFGCSGDSVGTGSSRGVAFVTVTPAAVAVFLGDTVQFGAAVTRFDGSLVDQPVLEWGTSDPEVATIDRAGKLTAIGSGIAVITAASGGVSGASEAQSNPVGSADHHLAGSDEFPHQEEPHLVIDGAGVLHVGWKEMKEPGAADRVAYTHSSDGGKSWMEAELLSTGAPGWLQSDPWLAVNREGTLFFARLEVSLSPFGTRVVVSRSSERGVVWEAGVSVADSADLDKEVLYSDGAGSLYLAYKQGQTLRLTRSEDEGLTWSEPSILPHSASGPTGPVLAARPDGSVVAAWWSRPDDNLWVAASSDFGESWGDLKRVNPASGSVPFLGGSRPAFPAIASSASGRVSLAWQDFAAGNWDILITHSDDRGKTWTAPVRVNDAPFGDQFMPALATGPEGSLHAAWYDSRTGKVNLVCARSLDGGETWSENLRVSTEETAIFHSRLGDYLGLAVGSSGEAYVVWTDRRTGVQNIYFARSSEF